MFRTFTVLCYDTILQKLCGVCIAYIENKNERTLVNLQFLKSIQFEYKMIDTKEEVYYVLYVNDYI